MVNNDPDGGGWYCCNHCSFTGDSIQLLSHIKQMDIDQTIEQLRRADTTGSFTPKQIDDYTRYITRRKAIDKFWAGCSDRQLMMETATDGGRMMLESFRLLKPMENPNWSKQLGQFVGLTDVQFYTDTVRPDNLENRLPGQARKNYLIAPMFDTPGRIAAIAAFDIHGSHKRHSVIALPRGSHDVLMFMNGLQLYEEVVYATNRLDWALALQVWAYLSSAGPLPVVGYLDSSRKVWKNLRPRKVIFWDRQPTPALFEAARQVEDRAYIAKQPYLEHDEDPFVHLQGTAARTMLAAMQQSAEPWLKVLKDYLTSSSYSETQDIVNRLDLAPSHRQEMLNYCQTKEEREKISALVDTGVIQMSVPMGVKNRYLLQKADGWWIQHKNEAEHHLACEAMPVIETFTSFKNRVVFTGHIRIHNKSLPFEVDRDKFSAEWLIQFCQEHGEIVEVHNSIYANFRHFALQFNAPSKVDGLDYIGWDDRDQTFVFPRHTLLPTGEFRAERRPIPGGHPSEKFEFQPSNQAPKSSVLSWLEPSPAAAAYWATYAAVLSNILAPVFKMKTSGIVLADDSQTASDILERVADNAYLATFKVEGTIPTAELLYKLTTAEVAHGMPLAVDFRGSSSLAMQWIQSAGDRNSVVALKPALSRSALLRGGWIVIRSNLAAASSVITSSSRMLPILLAFFQKNERKLTRGGRHLVYGALQLVQAWLATEHQIESPDIFKTASRLIETGPGEGAEGIVSRFIGIIDEMMESELISFENATDLISNPSTKTTVIYGEQTVSINYPLLMKVVRQHHIHLPPSDELTAAFKQTAILADEMIGLQGLLGWVLHRPKWVEHLRTWR